MTTDKPKSTASSQPENRADYIHNGAFRCAISQGYSADTAYAFAAWAQDYAPEVQGFSNLFNAYMTQQN